MLLAKSPIASTASSQSDLALWSEASVRDRLLTFYQAKFADATLAAQASRCHWSIWRAYFADLALHGRASRQALAKLLSGASLPTTLIDEGDNIVIDEIVDLILLRFRRAPHQAKAYAKCLTAATTRMGQARGTN